MSKGRHAGEPSHKIREVRRAPHFVGYSHLVLSRRAEHKGSRTLAMGLGVLVAVLCTAPVAHAEPTLVSGASLSVVRAPGAEDCPDASALASSLQALGTNAAEPATPLEIQISFAHGSAGYSAVLVTRGRTVGERELHAADETCAGVASSAVVALAVLLDVRPRDLAPSAEERTQPRPPDRREEVTHWTLALTAHLGVAYGLLGPRLSATAGGSLQWRNARWQFALGPMWALPRSVDHGSGRVIAQLIAGRAAASRLIPYAEGAALGACASLFAGVIAGSAHGYSVNGSESRAWGAASASALWRARLFRGLALRAEVQALVPFRRQEFSIDGLGVVYRSSPAAALLEIGAELTIW
jgi:hypothetical protein